MFLLFTLEKRELKPGELGSCPPPPYLFGIRVLDSDWGELRTQKPERRSTGDGGAGVGRGSVETPPESEEVLK